MLRSVYFEVTGRVQGVFFRKHTKKTCDKYDVCGWVLNTSHGSVQGLLEGTEVSVDKVKNWLQKVGSPKSRIDKCSFLKETTIDTKTSSTFNIIRDKQEVKRKTFEM
ncbi:acylphosphatase-2-like [Clavelina lepadiformis]|uniref:acylphosphatase-2-like n=1 Tax=Clavelina lepadiformis TaxID=159417 RepID=UPI004042780F